MNVSITSLLLILFAFVSCSKNGEHKKEAETGEIVNTWIFDGYDNQSDEFSYSKASELDFDKPGWVFESNGDMIERNVNGFCATPPVVYANYENKWTRTSNNMIAVEGTYWGGKKSYSIEVVSLTSTKLRVKIHY